MMLTLHCRVESSEYQLNGTDQAPALKTRRHPGGQVRQSIKQFLADREAIFKRGHELTLHADGLATQLTLPVEFNSQIAALII